MYIREMENIEFFIIFLKGRKKEKEKKQDQKNMVKGKHKIDCLHYLKTHRAHRAMNKSFNLAKGILCIACFVLKGFKRVRQLCFLMKIDN